MIKKFDELKNEVLYKEVQCNLIAKEFSHHNYCYKILTKLVYKGKKNVMATIIMMSLKAILVVLKIMFLLTFWKIIKLLP